MQTNQPQPCEATVVRVLREVAQQPNTVIRSTVSTADLLKQLGLTLTMTPCPSR